MTSIDFLNEENSIQFRYQSTLERISKYCEKYKNHDVKLIAVSKAHPPEAILELNKITGHFFFGENYAQELSSKAEKLKEYGLKWAFIGQLQSNKIKTIIKYAHEIHGLSQVKHIICLEEQLKESNRDDFPVYIGVNIGKEKTKSGLPLANVMEFSHQIRKISSRIRVEGIFSVPPPLSPDEEVSGAIPETYLELRKLADQIGNRKLSLGMSRDLELAIAAGSNCVRVGTSIFGERNYT